MSSSRIIPTRSRACARQYFEEKVVDQLLGQISVTDVVVTKEALMADDEEADASKEEKPKAKAKAKAKKADAEE
jgi:trigger factor